MTDKEKKLVKEAVVSIFDNFNILEHTACLGELRDDILRLINSMPEEPVSEIDFEQELYKYFGQVKDFTLGMRIAKRFYEIGRNYQEPVSEEFEKALAEEWQGYVDRGAATVDALEDNTQEIAFAKGFYRGANWQKEQMIAKAVEVTIAIPYPNGDGGYSQLVDSKEALPFGDNIKVLVIKEE